MDLTFTGIRGEAKIGAPVLLEWKRAYTDSQE
jgi:hypothetical protein